MVTADFNGDGIPDLAVSAYGSSLNVLLGDGKGNFTPTATSPTQWGYLAVGDFNGDGVADLAVANSDVPNPLSVLQGNGDGTFTLATSYPVGSYSESIAVGDFNGDGGMDVAVADFGCCGSGDAVTILLTEAQTATATTNGIVFPVASGGHAVVASFGGDATYKASTSAPTGMTAAQGTATVSLTASPNPGTYGASVTLTATVTGGGVTPTNFVTFYDGSERLGNGTLSGGVATYTTSTFTAGAHSLTATYAGDSNYTSGATASANLTITQTTPTIALSASATSVTVGTSVVFTATLSGGGVDPTGTVTFLDGTTQLGTGTLSGGVATYSTSTLAAGTHSITAHYGGDSNYTAVTSAATTVTVVVPSYTLSASTTAVTITAGNTADVTITAATTNYTGSLAIKIVSSDPLLMNANLVSGTLSSGGIGSGTLEIFTTVSAQKHSPAKPWKSGGAMMVCAVLLGAPFTLRRRRAVAVLMMAVAISLAGFAMACSGGGVKVPPRIYTLTLTPTGTGTVSNPAPITITVTVP